MKTKDHVEVFEGDTVFVIGSCGVHSAKVLEPVTSYEWFGNIPVRCAFSTKVAAEEYLSNIKFDE